MIACPNKNTVEWRELLRANGGDERKAYEEYLKNDGSIPVDYYNHESPNFKITDIGLSDLDNDLLIASNNRKSYNSFRVRKDNVIVNSIYQSVKSNKRNEFYLHGEENISFKDIIDSSDSDKIKEIKIKDRIRAKILPKFETYDREMSDKIMQFLDTSNEGGMGDMEDSNYYKYFGVKIQFGKEHKEGEEYTIQKDVIEKVKQHIEWNENTRIVRYSKLREEFGNTVLKDIVDDDLIGNDPFVVIHGLTYSEDRKTVIGADISLIEITTVNPKHSDKSLRGKNLFNNYVADKSTMSGSKGSKELGVTLNNDSADLRKLKLAFTGARIKQLNENVNVRNMAVLHVNANKGIKRYNMHYMDAVSNIEAIRNIPALKNRLSLKLQSIVGNKHLTNLNKSIDELLTSYGLELKSQKQTKIIRYYISELEDYIEGKKTKYQLLESLKQRRNYLQNQLKTKEANYNNNERKLLAEIISQLEGFSRSPIKKYNRSRIANMGSVQTWRKNISDIGNIVIQDFQKKVKDTTRKIRGQYIYSFLGDSNEKEDNTKWNYHLNNIRKIYMQNNPEMQIVEKGLNISEKMWQRLFIYETYTDDNGVEHRVNTMRIHWDKNNPETAELLAKGSKDGISIEEVEAGKFIVDTIEKHIKALIRNDIRQSAHIIKVDKNGKVIEDTDKLERLVEDRYNANWERGLIPVIKKRGGQYITKGKILKGIVTEVKTEANFVNDMSDFVIDDVEGGLSESVKSIFYDQFIGATDSRYGSDERLKLMGLKYSDEDNSPIKVELDESGKPLTGNVNENIEDILDLFVLDTMYKIEMDNEVLPAKIDAEIRLNAIESIAGDQSNNKKVIEVYANRIAHHKNIDFEGDVAKKGMKAASVAMGVVSFAGLAFNPKVALTSWSANKVETILMGLTNSIYNPYKLFTMKDYNKAAFLLNTSSKARKKADMLMKRYNVYMTSKDDLLGNIRYKKTNRNLITSHTTNWMTWVTDYNSRRTTMVAQMMYEGSWDAHDVVGDKLVYNVKEDKRYFNEDGTQTKQQKALMDRLVLELKNDPRYKEEQEKSNYPVIGYDSTEERRFEWISNKFIIGTYDREDTPVADGHVVMRTVMQFKKYIYSKVEQRLGGRTTKDEGGYYVAIEQEDGSVRTEWQEIEMEGYFVTLYNYMADNWKYIKEFKMPKTREEWNNLSDMEKHNVVRAGMDLMMIAIVYALFTGISGLADDDDKKRYLSQSRILRSFKNGALTMLAASPTELLEIGGNIAVINYAQNIIDVVFGDKTINKIGRNIPGSGMLNTIDEIGELGDILFDENINY